MSTAPYENKNHNSRTPPEKIIVTEQHKSIRKNPIRLYLNLTNKNHLTTRIHQSV